MSVSGTQTIGTGPFGRLPILVLSRDPAIVPPNWPAEVARANAVVWSWMQQESIRLSSNGRQVIAQGSDHYVQLDRPDLVIREVTRLIGQIRADAH